MFEPTHIQTIMPDCLTDDIQLRMYKL